MPSCVNLELAGADLVCVCVCVGGGGGGYQNAAIEAFDFKMVRESMLQDPSVSV